MFDPMEEHPVCSVLAGFNNAKFELFGSHLMGNPTAKSDVDLLCALKPEDFPRVERVLRALGFKNVLRLDWSELGRTVTNPDVTWTASGGTKKRPDSNILGIFKWEDPSKELPDVDVIIVDPDEGERRMRTLRTLGALLTAKPMNYDIEVFVQSLKSNHPHWRALHLVVDAAYKAGRKDQLLDDEIPF